MKHHRASTFSIGQESTPPAKQWGLSYQGLVVAAQTWDAIAIVLANVAADVIYVQAFGGVADPWRSGSLGALLVGVLIPILYIRGVYTFDAVLEPSRSMRTIAPTWALALLFMVLVLFSAKVSHTFSRGTMALVSIGAPLLIYTGRYALARVARVAMKTGALRQRRAFLIHSGEGASTNPGPFVNVIGSAPLPASLDGFEMAVISRAIREASVDEVLLSGSWERLRQGQTLMSELRKLPLPVRLIADETISALLQQPIARVGGSTYVEVQRAPLSGSEMAIKRALDIVAASIALVLLCPLLVTIAVLVKMDSSGEVMFRQRRRGFNGREFSIYKFRTMTVAEDGPIVVQASRDDRRVTRVGSFLRRLSLDELPQLLNVLRGDMSLVGPRPHAIAHDDEFEQKVAKYAFRQHVKPGITGWSQVNGYRGETVTDEAIHRRVALDLWYIDHWSVWLDIWILMRTVRAVYTARNAY